MKLGKVIGNLWATRKTPELDGCRLYLVQPVDSEGRDADKALVVADPHNIAAPGDLIVYVTNTDATQAFNSGFAPVNACVVELVDTLA